MKMGSCVLLLALCLTHMSVATKKDDLDDQTRTKCTPRITEATKTAIRGSGVLTVTEADGVYCFIMSHVNMIRRLCKPMGVAALSDVEMTGFTPDSKQAFTGDFVFTTRSKTGAENFEGKVSYNTISGAWDTIHPTTSPHPCRIFNPAMDSAEIVERGSPEAREVFGWYKKNLKAQISRCKGKSAFENAEPKLRNIGVHVTETISYQLQVLFGGALLDTRIRFDEIKMTHHLTTQTPEDLCTYKPSITLKEHLGSYIPSQFHDVTLEESKTVLGGIIDEDVSLAEMKTVSNENSIEVPTAFDWTDSKNPYFKDPKANFAIGSDPSKCIGAPREQGTCGSCYALTGTAVQEQRYCLESIKVGGGDQNLPKVSEDGSLSLAPQAMVSCHHKGLFQCNGGMTYQVYMYLKDRGVPRESCFPYIADFMYCRSTCKDSKPFEKFFALPNSFGRYRPDLVRAGVMNDGPAWASWFIYAHMMAYQKGIWFYRPKIITTSRGCTTESPMSRHAAVIVGWGKDRQRWACGGDSTNGPNSEKMSKPVDDTDLKVIKSGEGEGLLQIIRKPDSKCPFGGDSQGLCYYQRYCKRKSGKPRTWIMEVPLCLVDWCQATCMGEEYSGECGNSGGKKFQYDPITPPKPCVGGEATLNYWNLHNSWGTNFGESGYIRILRGKEHRKIEGLEKSTNGGIDTGVVAWTPQRSVKYVKNGRCKCNGHGEYTTEETCHCDVMWGGAKCTIYCMDLDIENPHLALKCNDEGRATQCMKSGFIFERRGKYGRKFKTKGSDISPVMGHCLPPCRRGTERRGNNHNCLGSCQAITADGENWGRTQMRKRLFKPENVKTSTACVPDKLDATTWADTVKKAKAKDPSWRPLWDRQANPVILDPKLDPDECKDSREKIDGKTSAAFMKGKKMHSSCKKLGADKKFPRSCCTCPYLKRQPGPRCNGEAMKKKQSGGKKKPKKRGGGRRNPKSRGGGRRKPKPSGGNKIRKPVAKPVAKTSGNKKRKPRGGNNKKRNRRRGKKRNRRRGKKRNRRRGKK